MKIICFHNPEEENGYLSNWYLSEFYIDEIHFTSMEQYMMYKKAVLFHDMEIASKILQTSDVAEIKRLGRAVSRYDENYWTVKRKAANGKKWTRQNFQLLPPSAISGILQILFCRLVGQKK